MSVLKTYKVLTKAHPPTLTYQLDLEKHQLGRRTCDEVEAINQAIFLILAVERFDWNIYSPDYGSELEGLVGKRRSYITADIARRLTEALMQDDRIKGTKDFSFDFGRGDLSVKFVAETIFGDIPVERRYSIGGNLR